METAEKRMRIGHDDFAFRYEYTISPGCGCAVILPESFSASLNGSQLKLDEGQRKRLVMLYERLLNVKSEFTYGKMREAEVKTAVFLKDLADAMEKYYKVQIGLALNPASAAGELETRTFEELVRDIVSELAYLKKEVAERSGRE